MDMNTAIVRALRPESWTVTAAGEANTQATAQKAAAAGKTHYITGFSAAVTGAAVGETDVAVELKDGETTVWQEYFGAAALRGANIARTFAVPVKMTAGAAASLTIAALGTGAIGVANLAGYTEQEG